MIFKPIDVYMPNPEYEEKNDINGLLGVIMSATKQIQEESGKRQIQLNEVCQNLVEAIYEVETYIKYNNLILTENTIEVPKGFSMEEMRGIVKGKVIYAEYMLLNVLKPMIERFTKS